jgi:PQQ-dependent dehydrogenase (methanol/ethanol family)
MPLDAPGSLQDDENFDLLAFVLSKNGYPPRSSPFSPLTLFAALFPSDAGGSNDSHVPLEVSLPKLPATPKVFARPSTDKPTAAELLEADEAHWLMYNKDYRSQRYSTLRAIDTANADKLVAVCAFQLGQVGWYQPSPVIYAGMLYVTAANSTYAIDARTCKKVWQHDYVATEVPIVVVNRGVALYKGALYRTTPTGHLIALDLRNGKLLWDVWVSNTAQGYWLSAAPLVYADKVFLGEAGADFGANGHIYAFDAGTGERVWTFDLVPTGKQPGAETWKKGAATGGGSTWTSYSIDPIKGLLYAPIGNPAPDFRGDERPGSNLYSDSIVALHSDTGKLAWYVQQLAHDLHDWDTAAPAALYDIADRGFMAAANKGGWLYIYDRTTHKLIAQPEVSSHANIDIPPSPQGVHACPGNVGGVQWNGPAYSPKSRSLYVNSVEWCGTYIRDDAEFVRGSLYLEGDFAPDPREKARGWIRSFSAATGQQNWAHQTDTPMLAGVTPTGGDVLFTGDLNGDFLVMSESTGEVIYRFNTGGAIAGGVSTYLVEGKQYVAVASGNASRTTWGTSGAATVFVFGLPDKERLGPAPVAGRQRNQVAIRPVGR